MDRLVIGCCNMPVGMIVHNMMDVRDVQLLYSTLCENIPDYASSFSAKETLKAPQSHTQTNTLIVNLELRVLKGFNHLVQSNITFATVSKLQLHINKDDVRISNIKRMCPALNDLTVVLTNVFYDTHISDLKKLALGDNRRINLLLLSETFEQLNTFIIAMRSRLLVDLNHGIQWPSLKRLMFYPKLSFIETTDGKRLTNEEGERYLTSLFPSASIDFKKVRMYTSFEENHARLEP